MAKQQDTDNCSKLSDSTGSLSPLENTKIKNDLKWESETRMLNEDTWRTAILKSWWFLEVS